MKLTKTEKGWLNKLQAILNDCPSARLGFYTIGDPDISIYDRTKDSEIDDLMVSGKACDFCSAVNKAEANSDVTLLFPAPVHSTAG